jgi:DNA-binding GntR family transcriptional regulator
MEPAIRLSPLVAQISLKDHIVAVLLEAISAADVYRQDADLRLDERGLAEQLGISRTPLREALARLEQRGLVRIEPRKGVYIIRKSLDEILEMIIAWAALESMAARLATHKATDAELASLREMAAKFSREGAGANIAEYSDANIEFHQRILAMSHVPLLGTLANELFQHMKSVRRRAMREGNRAERSVVDHLEIIEALEARDADRASRLVREHTMRLHDHVERTWRQLEERSREKRSEAEQKPL